MILKAKVAAITGGANGIGLAAARLFASEGAHVCIIDNNFAAGSAAESEIKSKGGSVGFFYTDISDEECVKKTFLQIKENFGKLSILYNNASIFDGKQDNRLTDLPSDVWNRILAVNLSGLYYCSKYAIPIIIDSGGGSVINTSSSAGVTGIPLNDAYTASKGAIIALTRSMAVEYGPYKVRVNCIAPAAIRTDMVIESNLSNPAFNEKDFLASVTPVRRWGLPDDVAKLALFLASQDSSYINGTVIAADGGITINGTVNK